MVPMSQLASTISPITGGYASPYDSSQCSDDAVSNRIRKMEMEIAHLKKKNAQIASNRERHQQIQIEKETMRELILQKQRDQLRSLQEIKQKHKARLAQLESSRSESNPREQVSRLNRSKSEFARLERWRTNEQIEQGNIDEYQRKKRAYIEVKVHEIAAKSRFQKAA